MADDGSGEKTEEPTHKKLEDSRKKGQVWKSKDLAAVAVFLGGMGAVKALWPLVESETAALFAYGFDKAAHPEDLSRAITQSLYQGLKTFALLSVPLAIGAAVIGALVEFLQVGALFAPESVKPKLEKLDPIQGFKNLFSKKQWVELLKNLLKLTITGYVVFGVVRDSMGLVVSAIRATEPQLLAILGELVFRIVVRVGLLLLVFALFDVWWQRRSYLKDLMMTKDEVKREYKESEGDPQHKAHRRQMHQEILESAQLEAVKSADVVVTNPDHIAVALHYDPAKDGAPRVVCRGFDTRAETIKALASQHDVAILRNVPLAHALVRVELGEEIPEALYDAVAEVLTFVQGLRPDAAALSRRPAGT